MKDQHEGCKGYRQNAAELCHLQSFTPLKPMLAALLPLSNIETNALHSCKWCTQSKESMPHKSGSRQSHLAAFKIQNKSELKAIVNWSICHAFTEQTSSSSQSNCIRSMTTSTQADNHALIMIWAKDNMLPPDCWKIYRCWDGKLQGIEQHAS